MYEMTNEQRHAFYQRMSLFAYNQASIKASGGNLSDDELARVASDLELAEKELRRCGINPPSTVEQVSQSVNHYRRVANEYCGSWILIEAATEKTIEQYDKETELSDFVSICKEVAKANDIFLKTALGLRVDESGEIVAA